MLSCCNYNLKDCLWKSGVLPVNIIRAASIAGAGNYLFAIHDYIPSKQEINVVSCSVNVKGANFNVYGIIHFNFLLRVS